jgi:hypothetical protein
MLFHESYEGSAVCFEVPDIETGRSLVGVAEREELFYINGNLPDSFQPRVDKSYQALWDLSKGFPSATIIYQLISTIQPCWEKVLKLIDQTTYPDKTRTARSFPASSFKPAFICSMNVSASPA